MSGTADTLLAQAVSAVQKGDFRTAADRFERVAATIGAARPSDAVAAYESAARLRLMLDDPRRAATNVSRAMKLEPDSARVAKIHAEVTDKTGDLTARKAAWLAVVDLGDSDQRREAHIHLGTICRARNEHVLVESHFLAALDELGPDSDPTMRPELLLEISIARTTAGNYATAEAALAEIETVIDKAGPTEDDGLKPRIAGQRGLIALAQEDHATAMKYAEVARDGAVERNDVMTYLAASSLIAAIHEQKDRHVDAYDTYIRARESLGQLLGEQAKGLVQPAIQLFEERLGPEKFKTVWDAWVVMRKAARG